MDSKYRLIINLMTFIDEKLSNDLSFESRQLLLDIKQIIINELKM